MRLLRLRVSDFGAVAQADIEFGPGLNVLYGPNEIGKSTLADAIRLSLLLPHASTFAEQYRPWRGGRDPVVAMTFETEAQRIWRVTKHFGAIGSSLLEESRNGVAFDESARGRGVDGKVREILRWGIREPGGGGGGKGIPASFLATALLSTQSDVTAVLENSLQDDAVPSGKDRIAAALQAVAQDPLFLSLLRATQARHDEAFTERGARKTARDSPFRVAAERLKDARTEKERLAGLVDTSAGKEQELRDLTEARARGEELVAFAADRLVVTERLAAEAAQLTVAAEHARFARVEVDRIEKLCADAGEAEQNVARLASEREQAEQASGSAQNRKREADVALHGAQEAARQRGDEAAAVARQKLELRRAAADRAFAEAQQRLDAMSAAQNVVDQALSAERMDREQQAEAERASASLAAARVELDVHHRRLQRVALLERGLEAVAADEQIAVAQAALENAAASRARLAAAVAERDSLRTRRGALIVPTADAITAMRRLATDLARARGALDVGLLVTVSPRRPLDIRIQKDGGPLQPAPAEEIVEVEADTQVEIDVADVVAVRVTGGRREAQRNAQALEERWIKEVSPHLAAANVTDLDALGGRLEEARELESNVQGREAEIASLREQLESLSGSAEAVRVASERQRAAHAALGDVALDSLLDAVRDLGSSPAAALRKEREQVSSALDAAREKVSGQDTAHSVAEERSRHVRAARAEASAARDLALASFPEGLGPALANAQAALSAATEERQRVAVDLASLESALAAEQARIDAALAGARTAVEAANRQLEITQQDLTNAIAEHASQVGRLEELRRLRDAEDLQAAEQRLRSAADRQAALPVPERIVNEAEVTAAREALDGAKQRLAAIERDMHRAHGALEQVGGAVAREQLRDASEAFDLAELQEKEIETDYEAWKLLLGQLKGADAAQGSDLGQALAPAIERRFQALTDSRYDSIRLNAQLGTEGVLAGGAVRPIARISVGTREQLSTLYRIALADYLSTTVVLDDQLVQSDGTRMDWFRALLLEKARSFQIVVLTCRPGDYLAALVPPGPNFRHDTESGFVRSIDLARATQLR